MLTICRFATSGMLGDSPPPHGSLCSMGYPRTSPMGIMALLLPLTLFTALLIAQLFLERSPIPLEMFTGITTPRWITLALRIKLSLLFDAMHVLTLVAMPKRYPPLCESDGILMFSGKPPLIPPTTLISGSRTLLNTFLTSFGLSLMSNGLLADLIGLFALRFEALLHIRTDVPLLRTLTTLLTSSPLSISIILNTPVLCTRLVIMRGLVIPSTAFPSTLALFPKGPADPMSPVVVVVLYIAPPTTTDPPQAWTRAAWRTPYIQT